MEQEVASVESEATEAASSASNSPAHSDGGPEQHDEDTYIQRLQATFGPIDANTPSPEDAFTNVPDDAIDEYAFPLLRRPSSQEQKITLRSPTPEEANLPSQHPRPISHYLTGHSTQQQREQFEQAALSSEDVQRVAETSEWPGSRRPWRVTVLSYASGHGPTDNLVLKDIQQERNGRSRPGKKRRIILRRRLQTAEIAQQRAKETESEKRNRKNREKKVKRRQKRRDERAAVHGAEDPAEQASSE